MASVSRIPFSFGLLSAWELHQTRDLITCLTYGAACPVTLPRLLRTRMVHPARAINPICRTISQVVPNVASYAGNPTGNPWLHSHVAPPSPKSLPATLTPGRQVRLPRHSFSAPVPIACPQQHPSALPLTHPGCQRAVGAARGGAKYRVDPSHVSFCE